jgi:hypothetical protein
MLIKYWRFWWCLLKIEYALQKNTYQTASFFYPLILYQSIPLFSIHLNLCNPPFNCSTVQLVSTHFALLPLLCGHYLCVWKLQARTFIPSRNVASGHFYQRFVSGCFVHESYVAKDILLLRAIDGLTFCFRAFCALAFMSGRFVIWVLVSCGLGHCVYSRCLENAVLTFQNIQYCTSK